MAVSIQAFESLFDAEQLARVRHIVASAVEKSYPTDIRNSTRGELVHRTQCAMDIVATLRGDLKWTIQRIKDCLPGYLRMHLNGDSWEPSARSTWSGGVEEVDGTEFAEVAPIPQREERLVLLPHEV